MFLSYNSQLIIDCKTTFCLCSFNISVPLLHYYLLGSTKVLIIFKIIFPYLARGGVSWYSFNTLHIGCLHVYVLHARKHVQFFRPHGSDTLALIWPLASITSYAKILKLSEVVTIWSNHFLECMEVKILIFLPKERYQKPLVLHQKLILPQDLRDYC